MTALTLAWDFLKARQSEHPTWLTYGIRSKNKDPEGEYYDQQGGPYMDRFEGDENPTGLASRYPPMNVTVRKVPGGPDIVDVNGTTMDREKWERIKENMKDPHYYDVSMGPESYMGPSFHSLDWFREEGKDHTFPHETHAMGPDARMNPMETREDINRYTRAIAPLMSHELMHGLEDLGEYDDNYTNRVVKPSFSQTEIPAYILEHATNQALRHRGPAANPTGKEHPFPPKPTILDLAQAHLDWRKKEWPDDLSTESGPVTEPDNPDYQYELAPGFV